MMDLERWMRARGVRHIDVALPTGSGRNFGPAADLVPGGGVILAGALCLADGLAVGAAVDHRTLGVLLPGVAVEEAYWLHCGSAEPRVLYSNEGWAIL